MNEIFDIKRLGRLIKYEVTNYIPNFFKSLLIFASVIAAVWIFSLTFDFDGPHSREELVGTLFILATVLSPFIVYKDMNDRKKGYIYAMIPASTLEKLLSMVVLCVVIVPLLAYAVLTATDLLLWLLSKVGIGPFLHMEFYNPFNTTVKIVDDDYLLPCIYPVFDSIIYLVNLIVYSIMFNTIFRKNKVMKTILFNIAISFAFVILIAVIANITTPEFWENTFGGLVEWLDGKTDVELFGYVMTTIRCLTILMSMAFLSITYFRIKKANY